MKTKALLSVVLFILGVQTLFAATPTITSFSPSSGPVGTLVTITGADMSSPTAFSIGGKPAIVISNTGTQLVGMVMPGAVTGGISVTTAEGTATGSGNFTVTPTLYPNTQQGTKLAGTGGIGAANQGFSVAISADGNTVVVGANSDNSAQGAAWIYVQSGGNWVQQGSKLVGTGNSGAARQGSAVAISADGNTVAIGGIADHGNIGAAWIFTRTAGVWTQQGSKIVGTGNVGASKQGLVSLSADGNTLAVGGSGDDELNGAVWMFTRSAGTWTQQGAKLVGTGFSFNAEQGKVALSADGNTAIVGGFMDGGDNSNNHGAAWIFTRNAGVWSQQGDRLIGTGGSADAAQGSSVAISADGNTAIIGGYNDKNDIAGSGLVGAAWIFTRTGGTWTQQGAKLAGTGAIGEADQGWSVALSADGNVAMIGGKSDNTNQGAVWVFRRSGNTWAQQGVKQVGTGSVGNALQGSALAMSADGRVAIEGGPNDNNSQGAAWAFNYVTPPPPPSISSFSPSSGRVGTLVTITGTNLSNPIAFSIGGVPAIVVSNTGTQVVGMVMPGATTGKVTLITTGGTANSAVNFTVTPTLYSYFQQGSKLSGSGNIGQAVQGFSSAVSADGNTAIVGGYKDNNGLGAAWIYTRSGGTWTQQGKLVGTTGSTSESLQGTSVAISADGNTVIVGGFGDNNWQGAAWIFTRNGNTWTQQGAKLVGTGGSVDANQGRSVSLSADGNTAVVGGSGDNNLQGALWVYIRSNGVWSQQGAKLIGTGNTGAPAMGSSVAISANGAVIVAGGQNDNNLKGAIWIFTQNNGTWAQLGNKLVGSGGSLQSRQGGSAAISADGSMVVEGGVNDNNSQGAIWVFGKSGNIWTQQGAKLVGTGNTGQANQGSSVAISADGNTITESGTQDDGSIGAVWTFNRSGSNWLQQGVKLVGSGATGSSRQGSSVALSADGSTLIEGGAGDNSDNGATWIFMATPPATPAISSFSPASGEVGTLVTVTGSNLLNLSSFSIGGMPAIVLSNTDSQVVGLVMPGAISGSISLTTSGGTAASGNFTVTHNTPHPYLQNGAKLPGTGPADSFFAYALAISADGKTAAVGVRNDNNAQGGVLIFTKSGNTWNQQGTKLVGNAAPVNAEQGFALAISADGNTVLVGSLGGAVWVFTRNGTVWTQQGPKLTGTGSIGADTSFGYAVSLSADGNTALIGGLQDNDYQGAAWIFKRTGATWAQVGGKLTGSGIMGNAALGTSVALSADGNTAVVGGPYDNGRQGAVWVFTNNGGIWAQLGAKLVGTGSVGPFIYQGNAVAVSADGKTLVEGGYADNTDQGAVWVFTRSGNTFLQQGAKLVGTGAVETVRQGSFIAVSADGNTIIEGAPNDNVGLGSLWSFTRSGNTWTQLGSKFRGTGNIGNSLQGSAIALTTDGSAMIEGGYADNSRAGAMWTFTNQAAPPTIASFGPATGPVGTLVTLTGTNLNNPTAFKIGGVPAIVISNSGTQLVGMVMPGATTGGISFSTSEGTATIPGNFTVTPTLYPKVQMGEKLAAGSNIQQGWSVALSADGTTAVVGTRNYDNGKGAALIFTRSGNTWTQQGLRLQGTGYIGNSGQGVSVAISADGNTVLIGGNGDNNGQGAAWVFTRNGGVWTQQGTKLVGSGGTATAYQGEAVTLSADGNTAVLGGPSDNFSRGAVWVFNRYGINWLQYGNKLVANGNNGSASLGNSVGISADGNTIIAGGEADNSGQGAAWIFTRNGGSWIQQGDKLVGTGGLGKTYQGLSVAINADGNTAIMSGPGDNTNQGAVWVFTRSGTTWSQQGPKLVGTGNAGVASQGWSVSLSADGNTVFEGGYADNSQLGATWAFTRSSGVWTQRGPKMVGTGATSGTPEQGRAVALSADGSTGIEGGSGDIGGFGAVWTFIPGKYSQTITFTLSQPLIYGVAAFTPPATSTNNTIPITYSSSDTTVAKIVNNKIHVVGAGTAAITASQAGDADYAAATPVTQTLTVNKAPLTISAKNTIGLINHPLPVLAVRYTGFVNGETDSSLTTRPITATTATASSPAGDYPVTVSGAASANYSFTYVPGTLTLSTTTNVTVVSSFNPIAGSPGRLVTVIGSHLDNVTGFTIGGVPAIVVSNSGSKLVGMVMPGATTGGVTVTTATGTSTGPGVYTVTPTPHPSGQQGSKLTASASVGQPSFGTSVDVDAEGTTAVIGAPGDNGLQGAVFIFTRTGNLWTQQGGKLAGTGNTGTARLGSSVAISADGNTVIAGGQYDNNSQGAAWIFTRTNGIWSQQGGKLTGTGSIGSQPAQGHAVAISADGNTAVISGHGDSNSEGAVWVFTRSGSTWTQQGSKLVGTGNITAANQGSSVAISADGNTIAEGGGGDNSGQGAVWIFNRSGGVWSQQGSKLVGTGNTGAAAQGSSVALSADGNILLSGASVDNSQQGAIWVFQRSGSVWLQRGSKFSGYGGIGQARQGTSVALSADGTIATVGASLDNNGVGASWVFSSNGSSWVQQSAKRIGTGSVGKAAQGLSVSISSNGKIALVGGPTDNNDQGAVWIYSSINTPAPVITSISPASGPVGTLVKITGTNLSDIKSLTFGGTRAVIIAGGDNSLTAMVMPGSVTGSVILTTGGGSATADDFTVTPTLYPTTQQGDKLVGNDAIGKSQQGYSVALSADGNTAVVGGPADNNNQGTAWVYTRSGNTWSQQGPKLIGSGSVGAAKQGTVVAINADGNTVIIGGPSDNNNQGAAWIFTRNNGIWTQQGSKLVGAGSIGAALQGSAIAISGDGNTAVLGGHGDNASHGAAWIFMRKSGAWIQQGNKLVGIDSDIELGSGVAITADGNTILTGGWLYTRNADVWIQQNNRLTMTGNCCIFGGSFGALTADGNKAIIGGVRQHEVYWDENGYDLFYTCATGVFTKNGDSWVYTGEVKGPALYNASGSNTLVAMSADGNTILQGEKDDQDAPGRVWVLGSDTSGLNLVANGTAGYAFALSADGNTAVIGYPHEDTDTGGVRFFISSSPSLQAITFATPPASTYGSTTDIDPGAISTNTALPIIYKSSDTTIATIVNNKIRPKAAGTTYITASQANNITPVMRPFTVNKAVLTIAADNQTKKATSKNGAAKLADQQKLTVKYSGFVHNENEENLIARPVVATPADDGLPAGTYPITVSGAVADNYTFNYLPGKLTVNAADDLLTDITKSIVPYPNSFQTVIKLDLGADNIRDVSVQISSVSNGGLVYSKKYANQAGILAIDANNFRDGVYILKLTCNQWQRAYKIWKK